VRDSDSTLIFYISELKGGTLLTLKMAEKMGRPLLAVNLEKETLPELPFLSLPGVLNIAGPRESQSPGIYRKVFDILQERLVRRS
jgi:Circularly permutated YpsA SLOG family